METESALLEGYLSNEKTFQIKCLKCWYDYGYASQLCSLINHLELHLL